MTAEPFKLVFEAPLLQFSRSAMENRNSYFVDTDESKVIYIYGYTGGVKHIIPRIECGG